MKYAILAFFLILSSPTLAKTSEQDIIDQMASNGYQLVERERTWLGRIALEFQSATDEREIIFNPVSGTIIRDYTEDLDHKEEGWLDFFGISTHEHEEND